VNIIIMLNGQDVTANCFLPGTKIRYDTTKRITTAALTILSEGLKQTALYDYAHYDQNVYSISLKELYRVTILDGRDGVTKLFDGHITTIEMDQTDAPGITVAYKCTLNDWAAYLDRAVCWDSSFNVPMPSSDKAIITALVGHFCPQLTLGTIAQVVPQIQKFDWQTKTCRQVLDDMTTLSMGEWRVDFNGVLTYGPASAAPAAPYALSTTPDGVTSFPVRVESYKHDFSNPINVCYVRGAIGPNGVPVAASYTDPVSVQQYGTWASAVVDTQITTGWDASLRAKSVVLTNAYPIETGNFIIWTDGLACGMAVSITENNIGFTGTYWIRALEMVWEDQYTVKYTAQFGSVQPDLETLLRLIAQRTAWATSTAQNGTPVAGSVTDASIGAGGLSAQSIGTVNANSIIGTITASQIGSVNASSLLGQVAATQIAAVNATSIQGAIQANQIGAVNATTIQGVVVSSQLASGIIDTLSKYAGTLRPVPMVQTYPTLPDPNYPANSYFYYVPNGTFYQITSNGLSYTSTSNPSNSLMNFYHIGAISASSITGLILAAQIQSITAGQVTGQIQANQIAAVNASAISGQITASQIASVNATAISGQVSASQISSVTASTITGGISSTQITSVNAGSITLGTMSVGGVGTQSINVYNGSSQMVAQIGVLSGAGYGGWFLVFGAGGSGYSTANVYTDTGGNLYIKQATFTLVNGSYTISMNPTTFDPTYSSLTIDVVGGSDKASHVSRGMVLYTSGSVIGDFVRAPSGGAQLEINGGGSNYVLINPSGVRSDQGFTVGSVGKVIDSAGHCVGPGALFGTNGVQCGGVNPLVGGTQYNGVAGPFTFKSSDGYTITVAGGCIVAHSP
jgi:hypothetical protein